MQRNQGTDLGNQNRFGFLEAVSELFIFRSKLFAVSTPIITDKAQRQYYLTVHLIEKIIQLRKIKLRHIIFTIKYRVTD